MPAAAPGPDELGHAVHRLGTIPLGNVVGGALGTWIGLRETLIIGSVGNGLAFLWILFSPMRDVREMPTEPLDVGPEVGSVPEPEPAGA